MNKEPSLALKICDKITKYSIFALIFLVPVFFLPWTSEVLDFNKQAILLLFTFVALFSWMLKSLISGKIEINKTPINIVVGALFLIYILSTIFSLNRYGSFWGWPQITSESLLSLMPLCLLYFLISSAFSKKDIFTSFFILSISALLAEAFGILQILGLFIIPFEFAKSVSFNTIGAVGALGFFAAILLPLAICMIIVSKKWLRLIFALEIIFSAVILFLVNYSIIWWVVALGAAFLVIFGITKRDLFDARWMALPMFFLAVSVFFIILNPQFTWLSQRPNEIFLSQGTSFQISLQALKSNPVFGSGPGTFANDFSKFKSADFEKGDLWNATFNNATSKIINDMATTGVLGFVAVLALMGFAVFYGIKFLFAEKSGENNKIVYWILTLGLSCVLIMQSITYFLYSSGYVLDFVYFFAIAALTVLTFQEKKQYELKPSSLLTLIITFAFTLVFIFGLGLLFLDGQRYVAEVNYLNGLAAWQSGQKDQAINNLETAASLNSGSDLYFRQLSQAYLLKLQDELNTAGSNPSDAEKNKVQILVANSVNAAKFATDLNPKSASNWSVRGYVYQNLSGLIADAEKWAISSYDSALQLDPNNPYLFLQEGSVYYQQKDYQNAKTKLEKAIALTPSYSNALYYLGLVYDALGQKDKAVAEFTLVKQLNPDDKSIQQIIDNLNAGRSALQTVTPPAETPPTDTPLKNPPATKTK